MWTGIQDKLDLRRSDDRRAYQKNLDSAERSAKFESDQLNSYLTRGDLRHEPFALASVSLVSQTAGFDSLGVKYLFGNYSPSRHDESNANVESFLRKFKAISSAGCSPTSNAAICQSFTLAQPPAAKKP